jgi:hypothetical protein
MYVSHYHILSMHYSNSFAHLKQCTILDVEVFSDTLSLLGIASDLDFRQTPQSDELFLPLIRHYHCEFKLTYFDKKRET